MSTDNPIRRRRRILWQNVLTVVSAAILISAEVFGAAFAGSWALENLSGLGGYIVSIFASLLSVFGISLHPSASAGVRLLEVVFFIIGLVIVAQFVRAANRIEPFTTAE
jgi:hypothetical protein